MDYTSKKLTELQSLCRERGLKISGKKSELISRLSTSRETPETPETSKSPELPSFNKLELMTKKVLDLKTLCKEYKLQVSGSKSDLINRLLGQQVVVQQKKRTTTRAKQVPNIIQKIIYNNTVHVKRNAYDEFEDEKTGCIFNELSSCVIARRNPDRHELTDEDIDLCKEMRFSYRIPNTLNGETHCYVDMNGCVYEENTNIPIGKLVGDIIIW